MVPFLVAGLTVWALALIVVLAACRAAARGDLALVTATDRRACESRRRRVLRRALSHVR